MKKLIQIPLFFVLVVFVFDSCKKSKTTLKVQDSYFAIVDGGEFEKIDEAIYTAGDEVYLFLSNVGEFKNDRKGYSHIEIDVEIKNDEGIVVFEQKDLLQAKGKMKLPDNIAGSPYGIWNSDMETPVGKYKFNLKIRDKLANSFVVTSRSFNIE